MKKKHDSVIAWKQKSDQLNYNPVSSVSQYVVHVLNLHIHNNIIEVI